MIMKTWLSRGFRGFKGFQKPGLQGVGPKIQVLSIASIVSTLLPLLHPQSPLLPFFPACHFPNIHSLSSSINSSNHMPEPRVTPPLPNLNSERELHANGASLRIADLVPALGEGEPIDSAILHLRIGTTLDQVAAAPGQLTRTWKQEGRRYFRYSTPHAVPLAASIHSGRYEVARTPCGDGQVEIYVHPPHRAATPHLLAAAREALQCARDPDQYGWIRVVETPDYRRAVRPWYALAEVKRSAFPSMRLRQAVVTAPAGMLPYSEIETARRLP